VLIGIALQTVYRLLYAVAPKLAQDTFKAHAAFYHPIARKMIAKVGRGYSASSCVTYVHSKQDLKLE
jgi:hypothetical protein